MIKPSQVSSHEVSTADDELSPLPIWTFALGVFALLTLGLTSIPAVICGHRALAETRRTDDASLAKSVTVAGLVTGYVGLALLGVSSSALVRFVVWP